jgi:hypothetical protein
MSSCPPKPGYSTGFAPGSNRPRASRPPATATMPRPRTTRRANPKRMPRPRTVSLTTTIDQDAGRRRSRAGTAPAGQRLRVPTTCCPEATRGHPGASSPTPPPRSRCCCCSPNQAAVSARSSPARPWPSRSSRPSSGPSDSSRPFPHHRPRLLGHRHRRRRARNRDRRPLAPTRPLARPRADSVRPPSPTTVGPTDGPAGLHHRPGRRTLLVTPVPASRPGLAPGASPVCGSGYHADRPGRRRSAQRGGRGIRAVGATASMGVGAPGAGGTASRCVGGHQPPEPHRLIPQPGGEPDDHRGDRNRRLDRSGPGWPLPTGAAR